MKLTREQLRQLDKEQLIDIILAMQDTIAKLEARVEKLEAELAKNSANSSKPPSSDGFRKPKSLREKGKRKTGGQEGHKGETLKMVETPTYVEQHRLDECPNCQADLREVEAESVERRQVFDLPAIQMEVSEHRAEVKICPYCQARVKAIFPNEAQQAVQYGKQIAALAVYLNAYQLLPMQRTCDVLEDMCGHRPSEGWLDKVIHRAQTGVQPSIQAIRERLQDAEVLHCDESGMRVEGKLKWVHVVGTKRLTHYSVQDKRGQDGMNETGILSVYKGTLVHDNWKPYFRYNHARHALCNAHHLRELRFIHEQYHQDWAQHMTQLLLNAKREVESQPEGSRLPADRLWYYDNRYEDLLRQGFVANLPNEPCEVSQRGRPRQSPAKNLLLRLREHKAAVLAFIHDFRVPFDNNLAERDIRMVKLKQKISGTFRSWPGARAFCALRSYISTARKHGLSIIQSLQAALSGHTFIPA